MRKNFGPQSLLYPMPVLIIGSYDEDGTPNAMVAAWGGIADTNKIFICLSPEHQSVANILAKKAFTVSFASKETEAACDYFGLVSGKQIKNKVEKAGFHSEKSPLVDAPYFSELKVSLDCRLISYDPESCFLLADIVNVGADPSALDEKGRIDVHKLHLLSYDSERHRYIALGEDAGEAFYDGKKIR